MYLSLYCKGSKRVTQGFMVRGSWRLNRTAIYWPPLLWPSALCLSCFSELLNRRPRGPLCWMRTFSTASCHQQVSKHHRGSRGPLRPGLAFPTTSRLKLVLTPTPWRPVLSELYNSSIAHSVFGMACLIVFQWKQLSYSSEVTLFRCISLWVYHGLLPCPISSAKSAYAISFDYWPLECVTSFWCITLKWHVWSGRRSKYNRLWGV